MESSKDFQLPFRGPKICVVGMQNKSFDKDQLLQEAIKKINQHRALFTISSPRHLRSVAEFKSKNEIEVVKRFGKMFQYFGTQTKNSYTLLPEEALYLLEMNYLEIQWNTIPISLQQGYAILLDESNIYCKLRNYRIYSHLLRKSYRLVRHKPTYNENMENKITNIPPSKKKKMETQETITLSPLINDSIADVDEAVKRLQIFNTNSTPSENICFLYDGYNPQREFCKSNIPSDPDISVNYACSNDLVPTICQRSKTNQTKFIFALEGTKDIYYCVKHVSIKNLLQD